MIKKVILPYEELFTVVKRRKKRWYRHATKFIGLAKTVYISRVRYWEREEEEAEKTIVRYHPRLDGFRTERSCETIVSRKEWRRFGYQIMWCPTVRNTAG